MSTNKSDANRSSGSLIPNTKAPQPSSSSSSQPPPPPPSSRPPQPSVGGAGAGAAAAPLSSSGTSPLSSSSKSAQKVVSPRGGQHQHRHHRDREALTSSSGGTNASASSTATSPTTNLNQSSSSSSKTRRSRPTLCSQCKMKDAKHGSSGSRKNSGDAKSLGLLATSVRGWCRVCSAMLRWAQDGIQHRLPAGVSAADADPDTILAVCNRFLANRRDALAKHRAEIARAPSADADSDAKRRMQKLVSQVAVVEHLVAHVSEAPKSARQRAHVMSNPPPPPSLDSVDLDASGDDESSSHSSSGSESDSNSGGGGGGGGGDASADASKLKLLLAASGSANTSSSSLVKSDSGSFVKSPTSSLPKGESSKAVASSAHPSRPPPVTPGRSSATAATGSLASDVVVDAVVSGFASSSASPPTARPPAAPARRMSTDAGSMSPRQFDANEPVSASIVRPAVARRGSLETAVTASKPSLSPADVVDAVVSQSPPTSSASPPATTADRTSRSSGSGGATAAAASAAAKQKAPSAAAPAANAAAASGGGGASKEPGGMFSNMRKALARPSLGGLMRGKAKPKATPMFGVSIAEAAAAGGGMLPLPLLHSADVLVQRKLVDREGIFRLTGSIATINHIKELYNNDGAREAYQLLADEGNAHTIAGVLKLWLRELPERLIPNAILENVGSATRDIDRIALIVDVIKKLPPHNRVTLQKLCWVIHNAWQHRDANKMGVRNLSVVFAPNVLGLGRVSELMESLIRFYRFAFGIDPLPESDEALSAIMIEQFNDHTPTLSATNAAKAAAEAAATAPDECVDDDDQQQPPPPEQEYGEDEYAAEDGYGGAEEYAAEQSDVLYEGSESVDEAMARYNAMTDDELRANLTEAMTAQDFEQCLFLRDLLQARTPQA